MITISFLRVKSKDVFKDNIENGKGIYYADNINEIVTASIINMNSREADWSTN